MSLPIEILAERVDYDPETGLFTWKSRPPETFSGRKGLQAARWETMYAGRPAFTGQESQGYLVANFDKRRVKAHRAAWALVHGRWPHEVDHINGDRADNRLENLREVTRSQNCRNRSVPAPKSGVTGVYQNSATGKWCAFINSGVGEKRHLGTFSTRAEAASARQKAERALGYTQRHGG